MTRLRTFALLVVGAHWIVAIWHLFLAANVLPAPDNKVSWIAVVLLTLLHWSVLSLLWKLSDRFIGSVSLIFFSAAVSADLYEHFLHPSLNNVFMVAPGDWAAWFKGSVYILFALELLGLLFGALSLGGTIRTRPTLKPVDGKPGGATRLLSHAWRHQLSESYFLRLAKTKLGP
jgi:hypothetical protein